MKPYKQRTVQQAQKTVKKQKMDEAKIVIAAKTTQGPTFAVQNPKISGSAPIPKPKNTPAPKGDQKFIVKAKPPQLKAPKSFVF